MILFDYIDDLKWKYNSIEKIIFRSKAPTLVFNFNIGGCQHLAPYQRIHLLSYQDDDSAYIFSSTFLKDFKTDR